MENKLSQVRLGILGGGQLARLLVLKSHDLGLKPYVFGLSEGEPAREVAAHFSVGKLSSKKDLKKFFHLVDRVIFENEFFDSQVLQEVSQETGTTVCPHPRVMSLIQDRWRQKKLLDRYNIPTAPWVRVSSLEQLKGMGFPEGVVLKKCRQGYDGSGTYICKNVLKDKHLGLFVKQSGSVIAEQLIPFKRELALILVRNKAGQIVQLPLVQTFQEHACCVWVKGPVLRQKNLKSLVKKLKILMKGVQYVGVLAVELFETKEGKLLVNELAPRVHNSGHYSLEALSEDQFTLHLKAVLNMPLYSPHVYRSGFAMLNLLGVKKVKKTWYAHLPQGVKLHWYGKGKSRVGRKMGHLSYLSHQSPAKALNPLLTFKKKMNF